MPNFDLEYQLFYNAALVAAKDTGPEARNLSWFGQWKNLINKVRKPVEEFQQAA